MISNPNSFFYKKFCYLCSPVANFSDVFFIFFSTYLQILQKMKHLHFFSLMVVALLMAACSSSDEPEKSTSGKEIAERLNETLLGENSTNWLIPCENSESTLLVMVADRDAAHRFATHLINDDNWTDDKRKYTLPDSYGSVILIEPETEGLFLSMVFNVKDMKPLTLNIASPDYIKNLTNRPAYGGWFAQLLECHDCGAIFPQSALVDIYIIENGQKVPSGKGCPTCGSNNFWGAGYD